jgi:hypothetical protein
VSYEPLERTPIRGVDGGGNDIPRAGCTQLCRRTVVRQRCPRFSKNAAGRLRTVVSTADERVGRRPGTSRRSRLACSIVPGQLEFGGPPPFGRRAINSPDCCLRAVVTAMWRRLHYSVFAGSPVCRSINLKLSVSEVRLSRPDENGWTCGIHRQVDPSFSAGEARENVVGCCNLHRRPVSIQQLSNGGPS